MDETPPSRLTGPDLLLIAGLVLALTGAVLELGIDGLVLVAGLMLFALGLVASR